MAQAHGRVGGQGSQADGQASGGVPAGEQMAGGRTSKRAVGGRLALGQCWVCWSTVSSDPLVFHSWQRNFPKQLEAPPHRPAL